MLNLLAATLRMATPIGFASAGEAVAERSGTFNIGIEGVMLSACYVAALIASDSGPTAGLLAATAFGVLLMVVIAFLEQVLKADQFVIGLGVNLVALGLTTVLYESTKDRVGLVPSFGAIEIPVVDSIPWVGDVVSGQTAVVYLLVPVVAATVYLTRRTRWGLRIEAAGDSPETLDAAAVSVRGTRIGAMAVCGALVGMGAAALVLGQLSGFSENVTAGRGFLALAAVIIGRWRPGGAVAASLGLGVALAVTVRASTWAWFPDLNATVLNALPYVAALTVLAVSRRFGRPPAALGVAYERAR